MPAWLMIDDERLVQYPRDSTGDWPRESRRGIIWLRANDPFGRRRKPRAEAGEERRCSTLIRRTTRGNA